MLGALSAVLRECFEDERVSSDQLASRSVFEACTPSKLSLHAHYPNIAFETVEALSVWIKGVLLPHVMNRKSDAARALTFESDGKWKSVVDASVYSPYSLFCLPHCMKPEKRAWLRPCPPSVQTTMAQAIYLDLQCHAELYTVRCTIGENTTLAHHSVCEEATGLSADHGQYCNEEASWRVLLGVA